MIMEQEYDKIKMKNFQHLVQGGCGERGGKDDGGNEKEADVIRSLTET